MNLPQLPREPVRPEMIGASLEKEIWQPRWLCFCCCDTGLVPLKLVWLIIPDYKGNEEDKPVACQRRGCEAKDHFQGDPNYDQRFTSGICAELDKINRKEWEATILTKWEQAKNRQKLEEMLQPSFQKTNLRPRDRTPQEEQENQRRVADLVAADFKKEVVQESDEF